MDSIAIVSQKGGVGKTTVALNLALALADAQRRTLLIDLDPQGAIGHSLARSDASLYGVADILSGELTLDAALLATKHEHLTLLPRGRLNPVEIERYEAGLVALSWRRLLGPITSRFDYVLYDTPAGFGAVTRAALRNSDFALVPVQAEPLALRSIHQALALIASAREENPALRLLGVLPTMVDMHSTPSHNVVAAMWGNLQGVTETMIPRAEVFATASAMGLPLAYLGGPPSPEVRRFSHLATELDEVCTRLRKPEETDARPQRELL
jgi:chromosome partitioning protein